jgi:hypothetical protein
MLNTYIKNRGITQTLVNNNNQPQFNQINWDADYDGQIANISVTSAIDGNKKHYDIKLDNEDLANMLNIPSINTPIDKRLQMDFEESFRQQPKNLQIELPEIEVPEIKTPEFYGIKPYYMTETKPPSQNKETIQELLQSIRPNSHLSSPSPNEELIVPISIDDKTNNKYTLTPNKKHRRAKTHKTYKVYKKPKSYYLYKAHGIKKPHSKTKSNRSKTKKIKLYAI